MKADISDYNKEQPNYLSLIRDSREIDAMAKKYDLILVDHDAHWRANASDPAVLHSWLGETIHPGAIGHLEMGKLILQELKIFDPKSSCVSVKIK